MLFLGQVQDLERQILQMNTKMRRQEEKSKAAEKKIKQLEQATSSKSEELKRVIIQFKSSAGIHNITEYLSSNIVMTIICVTLFF